MSLPMKSPEGLAIVTLNKVDMISSRVTLASRITARDIRRIWSAYMLRSCAAGVGGGSELGGEIDREGDNNGLRTVCGGTNDWQFARRKMSVHQRRIVSVRSPTSGRSCGYAGASGCAIARTSVAVLRGACCRRSARARRQTLMGSRCRTS